MQIKAKHASNSLCVIVVTVRKQRRGKNASLHLPYILFVKIRRLIHLCERVSVSVVLCALLGTAAKLAAHSMCYLESFEANQHTACSGC